MLTKKEKFIENLKNKNFSLKSEKTRIEQSLTHKNSRDDDEVLQTVNSNTNKDQKEDIQKKFQRMLEKIKSLQSQESQGFSSLETPWSMNVNVGSCKKINP